MMNGIFLLLGTNLGNRENNLAEAQRLIGKKLGPIQAVSCIYQTDPWGLPDQGRYLNQSLQVRSALSPNELMETILTIESKMGRVRSKKWGERLIDIDILYYGSQTIESPTLTVPHPEIPFRRFTLVPMVEIASKLVHPILKKDQAQLLLECQDQLRVQKYPAGAPV